MERESFEKSIKVRVVGGSTAGGSVESGGEIPRGITVYINGGNINDNSDDGFEASRVPRIPIKPSGEPSVALSVPMPPELRTKVKAR